MNNCEHLTVAFRGWGRRVGEKIVLLTCLECGEKLQMSMSGIVYQVKRRSPLPTKTVHVTARITPARKKKILKEYGSFQAFADRA